MELISKEEVIKITKKYDTTIYDAAMWCRKEIEELPVVEERKIGHWIKLLNGNMECSECWVEHPIDTNYCPWCGAKMEGVK